MRLFSYLENVVRVRLIEPVEDAEDAYGSELDIFFLPRVGECVVSPLSGDMMKIIRIEHFPNENMILLYGLFCHLNYHQGPVSLDWYNLVY